MQVLANIYRRYFSVAPQLENKKAENLFSTLHLPIEIVLQILSYLPSYDLVQLGRTCHTFRALSKDYSLDIAKRKLFMQMRTERIAPVDDWLDFHYFNNRLIYYTGEPDRKSTVLENMTTNEKQVLFPSQTKNFGELSDFFFVIFYKDFLGIQFLCKETLQWKEPVNISKLVEDPTNKDYSIQWNSDMNTFVGFANGHLFGIMNGDSIFKISPLEFEDSTYATIDKFGFFGDCLVVTQKVSHINREFFLLQRYSLTTKEILAQRSLSKKEWENISHTYVTERLIVMVGGLEAKDPNSQISVNVYDMDFKSLNSFILPYQKCIPHRNNQIANLDYGPNPFFDCYGDRMVCLINLSTLLFIELSTGRVIKEYDIGVMEENNSNDYRVCVESENVVVTRKKSLELYDINTGKMLHRFITAAQPTWLGFAEPYHLLYCYETKDFRAYRAHLKLKDTGKKTGRRKTTRR